MLATPVDMVSEHGFLTPRFQVGAKETWYDVKLVVDSVFKGKLKHAKRPHLGRLPAALTPPPPFGTRGQSAGRAGSGEQAAASGVGADRPSGRAAVAA